MHGEGRARILRQVAAVNLKKTPGGAVASMRSIHAHAKRDAEFIREQVALYQPDLTIACGTFWICEEIFGLDPDLRGGQPPCHVHRDPRLGALVSFWHPQARLPADWLCHKFAEAVGRL